MEDWIILVVKAVFCGLLLAWALVWLAGCGYPRNELHDCRDRAEGRNINFQIAEDDKNVQSQCLVRPDAAGGERV